MAMKDKETMKQDAEGREKRRKIVQSVVHDSAMEGLPLDAVTLALFERYVDGSMTMQQIRETVLQQYSARKVSD